MGVRYISLKTEWNIHRDRNPKLGSQYLVLVCANPHDKELSLIISIMILWVAVALVMMVRRTTVTAHRGVPSRYVALRVPMRLFCWRCWSAVSVCWWAFALPRPPDSSSRYQSFCPSLRSWWVLRPLSSTMFIIKVSVGASPQFFVKHWKHYCYFQNVFIFTSSSPFRKYWIYTF